MSNPTLPIASQVSGIPSVVHRPVQRRANLPSRTFKTGTIPTVMFQAGQITRTVKKEDKPYVPIPVSKTIMLLREGVRPKVGPTLAYASSTLMQVIHTLKIDRDPLTFYLAVANRLTSKLVVSTDIGYAEEWDALIVVSPKQSCGWVSSLENSLHIRNEKLLLAVPDEATKYVILNHEKVIPITGLDNAVSNPSKIVSSSLPEEPLKWSELEGKATFTLVEACSRLQTTEQGRVIAEAINLRHYNYDHRTSIFIASGKVPMNSSVASYRQAAENRLLDSKYIGDTLARKVEIADTQLFQLLSTATEVSDEIVERLESMDVNLSKLSDIDSKVLNSSDHIYDNPDGYEVPIIDGGFKQRCAESLVEINSIKTKMLGIVQPLMDVTSAFMSIDEVTKMYMTVPAIKNFLQQLDTYSGTLVPLESEDQFLSRHYGLFSITVSQLGVILSNHIMYELPLQQCFSGVFDSSDIQAPPVEKVDRGISISSTRITTNVAGKLHIVGSGPASNRLVHFLNWFKALSDRFSTFDEVVTFWMTELEEIRAETSLQPGVNKRANLFAVNSTVLHYIRHRGFLIILLSLINSRLTPNMQVKLALDDQRDNVASDQIRFDTFSLSNVPTHGLKALTFLVCCISQTSFKNAVSTATSPSTIISVTPLELSNDILKHQYIKPVGYNLDKANVLQTFSVTVPSKLANYMEHCGVLPTSHTITAFCENIDVIAVANKSTTSRVSLVELPLERNQLYTDPTTDSGLTTEGVRIAERLSSLISQNYTLASRLKIVDPASFPCTGLEPSKLIPFYLSINTLPCFVLDNYRSRDNNLFQLQLQYFNGCLISDNKFVAGSLGLKSDRELRESSLMATATIPKLDPTSIFEEYTTGFVTPSNGLQTVSVQTFILTACLNIIFTAPIDDLSFDTMCGWLNRLYPDLHMSPIWTRVMAHLLNCIDYDGLKEKRSKPGNQCAMFLRVPAKNKYKNNKLSKATIVKAAGSSVSKK